MPKRPCIMASSRLTVVGTPASRSRCVRAFAAKGSGSAVITKAGGKPDRSPALSGAASGLVRSQGSER